MVSDRAPIVIAQGDMPPAPIEFPPPPGIREKPQWTGAGFRVGERSVRVLAYGAASSGWSDHLTALHEDAAGSDHFIDQASRRHALSEAQRMHPGYGTVVLEVGTSSGYLLEHLVRAMPGACVIGSDYTYGTLEKVAARLPQVPLLQFDLVDCPLPDASVDIVILLNVLEHIERDDVAVMQVHRILKPGGVMIAEVPAGEALYDSYDKALLHFRRYSMSKLQQLVRGAGFEVVHKSHLAFSLYPGFWLAKKVRRAVNSGERNPDATVQSSIAWSARIHKMAAALLSLEAALRKNVYLPFGIRCLVTCRKASL